MPETTALTLTNAELAQLGADLDALDGLRVKPGEFEPFTFNPELTWIIASNGTIVADKLKAFEKAKKSLSAQYKITDRMTITPENAEQVNAFVAALNVLQETVITVDGLQKISREKLNVGGDISKKQNRIPPSVLARLIVILTD